MGIGVQLEEIVNQDYIIIQGWPLEWETSLVVQWLRLRASTVEGRGSIPARETKIPRAIQHAKKKFFFLKGEAMKEERPVGRLLK